VTLHKELQRKTGNPSKKGSIGEGTSSTEKESMVRESPSWKMGEVKKEVFIEIRQEQQKSTDRKPKYPNHGTKE